MAKRPFIPSMIQSFGYAIAGLKTFFGTQRNARIHLAATFVVIGMGVGFEVTKTEWLILSLCIILVLAAEAFNTSLEFLTDLVSPDIHPIAKKVKDVAAAAVLICAIGTSVIGLIIFWPYISALLS